MIIVRQCRSDNQNRKMDKYENNYAAAKDTIEYYKMKNGELMAEKQMYIMNEKELREQLGLSKDEINDLKKKLGAGIKTITKVETRVVIDTIVMQSEPIYVDKDTLSGRFSFTDNWLAMNGRINYGRGNLTTTLDNATMSVPLTVGMSDDYKYFVSTNNPYVTITEINGVVNEKMIPKKKHWGIGINVGPGVYYDFKSKNIGYGIGAQIGINYNF